MHTDQLFFKLNIPVKNISKKIRKCVFIKKKFRSTYTIIIIVLNQVIIQVEARADS